MGKNSKVIGSTKLAEMREQAETKKKTRKVRKIIVAETLVVTVALTTAFTMSVIFKHECEELPDWDNVGVGEQEIDLKEIDGLIGLDEYCAYRYTKSMGDIEEVRGVLGDKLTDWYADGVNSDYFHYSCIMDYVDLQSRVAELEKTGDIMDALATKAGIVNNYEGCHEEDCEFNEFATALTTGDLQEKFIEMHQDYENLLQYYIDNTELTEDDLEYMYESELVSNFEYLESADVEIIPINPRLLKYGVKAIDTAYDLGLVEKRTLTTSDLEALESFPLYTSTNFWDEELLEKAGSLMQSVFNTASGIEATENTIVNITDIEDKEEWLKSVKAPSASTNTNKLSNRSYINFNLTGYNSSDTILMTYKVNSVTRKDLPEYEEIVNNPEIIKELKLYYAKQSLNSDVELVTDQMNTQDESTEAE